MHHYLRLLRPTQWIKNILVLVPLFFAREIFVPGKLGSGLLAFLVFCLVASSVYIVNDIADRADDKLHPTKSSRPLASGAISVRAALLLFALLLAATSFILWRWLPTLTLPVVAYAVLNICYSFYLKHVVIFDIISVALCYVLRVVGGGLATGTSVSRWLVLCTIFVALFIIIGKRRAELLGANIRPVLRFYSANFLDHLLTIAATLTIVTYSIYAVLGVSSGLMVYSVLFVIVGMFRYLYIIYQSGNAEFPERVLYSDAVIISSVLGWCLYMFLVFYIF